MVDNENNQWEEELEYTEDMDSNEEEFLDDKDSLSEEQAPQEDSEEYIEDEEYEEEAAEETPQKKSSLPLVALLLVLLLAGGFIAVPKLMNKDGDTNLNQNTQQQQNEQSSEDLAGSFFDAASNDDSNMMSINFNEDGEGFTVDNTENNDNNTDNNNEVQENNEVATVTDAKPGEGITESDLFADQNSQENDSIMVVYNKAVRSNPFKPPVVVDPLNTPYETINNTQFEIIEPPTTSVPDENLAKLLQTQISGIMYDSVSPAAIVNLNGVDHFVKVGDVIGGYKIVKITKDKVQISYKSNNYVASVGELFTKGKLEQLQAVADLEHKFGGRNKNN